MAPSRDGVGNKASLNSQIIDPANDSRPRRRAGANWIFIRNWRVLRNFAKDIRGPLPLYDGRFNCQFESYKFTLEALRFYLQFLAPVIGYNTHHRNLSKSPLACLWRRSPRARDREPLVMARKGHREQFFTGVQVRRTKPRARGERPLLRAVPSQSLASQLLHQFVWISRSLSYRLPTR